MIFNFFYFKLINLFYIYKIKGKILLFIKLLIIDFQSKDLFYCKLNKHNSFYTFSL
jgi:hypothetical protein